jgi:DHA1 family bicyclomycin/chloramphenicol resistance-like MFS transporter
MHDPVQGNAFRTLGRLLVVLRHRGFRCLLLLFSATSMPFMAYLALSSYIFQGLFGLSPQAYSLFFAFNAGMSMLGPLAHERFFRTAPRRLFFSAYLGIVVVAGLGLLLVGDQGPFIFALLCAPISFCGSALRPPATVLMLNQMRNDTGSLTALINSGGLLFGSLSMLLCALPVWPGSVAAQALMAILVGTACLLGWLWLDSRKIYEG